MKHRRAGERAGASSRDCRSDPSCATTKTLNRATAKWNGRAGLFARYEWNDEVSLAGGVSERIGDGASEDVSPYGTLNVLFPY